MKTAVANISENNIITWNPNNHKIDEVSWNWDHRTANDGEASIKLIETVSRRVTKRQKFRSTTNSHEVPTKAGIKLDQGLMKKMKKKSFLFFLLLLVAGTKWWWVYWSWKAFSRNQLIFSWVFTTRTSGGGPPLIFPLLWALALCMNVGAMEELNSAENRSLVFVNKAD